MVGIYVDEKSGNIAVSKSDRKTAKKIEATERAYKAVAKSMLISGRTLKFINNEVAYEMQLVKVEPSSVIVDPG